VQGRDSQLGSMITGILMLPDGKVGPSIVQLASMGDTPERVEFLTSRRVSQFTRRAPRQWCSSMSGRGHAPSGILFTIGQPKTTVRTDTNCQRGSSRDTAWLSLRYSGVLIWGHCSPLSGTLNSAEPEVLSALGRLTQRA
jgi:hypothetical protein